MTTLVRTTISTLRRKHELIRTQEQEKQYAYYIGDYDALSTYLDTAMDKTFENHAQMPRTYIPITRKIIDLLAIIYLEPAKRAVYVDGQLNETLTNYINKVYPKDVNIQDKYAHRLAKLHNVSLPMLSFNNGVFQQVTHPSFFFEVEIDENQNLTKVCYPKDYPTEDGNYQTHKVVWTKNEHYVVGLNGKDKTPVKGDSTINPFGVLPLWGFRMNESSTDYWGEGQNLLIQENETINLLSTKANYDDLILGTSGAILAIDVDEDQVTTTDENGEKKVQIGKSSILFAKTRVGATQQPDMKFIATTSQIEAVMKAIDWKVRLLALSLGLNPATFSVDMTTQSGISRLILRIDQTEIRRDDLEQCKRYEYDRFNILRKMNNAIIEGDYADSDGLMVIPDNAELRVDFQEVEIPATAEEEWLDITNELRYHQTNLVEMLRKANPDIQTVEEAIEILDRNMELNEKYNVTLDPQEMDSRLQQNVNQVENQSQSEEN